jgi:hypothetical protein
MVERFASIIDAFGGAGALAQILGLRDSHVRTMRARNSIPVEYWPALITAAADRGVPGVTFETMARLAAAKREKHTSHSEDVAS